MRRLLSKVPYLVVILLLAYAAASLVPRTVWNENRVVVGLILGTMIIGFLIYFKWLSNRMSFLTSWPNPASNSRIRRYLLLRDYTARTARTRNQIVVSLLIPFVALLLFVTATGAASLFLPVSDSFSEALFSSSLPFILGAVFLNPVFHCMVFRLRLRYDLTNALLSIVVYLPIFIFVITALLHLYHFFRSDGTPFLSISWFEVSLASYFGAIICILTVVTHRIGFSPEPAPAMISHRYYQWTEVGVSLASLIGVAIILLLAS